MSLKTNLVSFAIMAICLAAYDLYFKGLWEMLVTGITGRNMGLGEASLGYFLMMLIAYSLCLYVRSRWVFED